MTAAGSVPPEAVAVQRAGAALSLPERATTKVDARDDGERPRRVVCPRSFASPFATPSHWLGGGHVSAVIATSRMNCAGCERSRACGSHRSRRGVASPACFASRACIFFFRFPSFRDVTDTCDCLRRHRQQLRIAGGAYWSGHILAVTCGSSRLRYYSVAAKRCRGSTSENNTYVAYRLCLSVTYVRCFECRVIEMRRRKSIEFVKDDADS